MAQRLCVLHFLCGVGAPGCAESWVWTYRRTDTVFHLKRGKGYGIERKDQLFYFNAERTERMQHFI